MVAATTRFILAFGAALSATTVLADPTTTCDSISSAISNSSQVYWPGSPEYTRANAHFGGSSTQNSTCAVEPGTSDDLAIIIKITGSDGTPFAVKSGGHATNPGFSSTSGVQISLSRFSDVVYNNTTFTVRVGTGLTWEKVYAALEPHGVNVAGGRVPGVGVGGFATGGGYSWKSNQYGLLVDTITAYDLVLPNGTFVVVTNASDPDLFFGLKGGFNNYGVVTALTLKALPQSPEVWGGYILYTHARLGAVSAATQRFSDNNKDPKASIITAYNSLGLPNFLISVFLFYDGPDAHGIFDEFVSITSVNRDVSKRSFSSFVNSLGTGIFHYPRVAFHTISLLSYSQNILDIIANETSFWGSRLLPVSAALISYDIEPFHGVSTHATPSAYPHDTPLLPLNLYFAWRNAARDLTFTNAMKDSVQRIYDAAIAEGQDISIDDGKQIRYPNYALSDTPLEQMYGGNVQRLKDLRAQYDPENVMSLTGGFRF